MGVEQDALLSRLRLMQLVSPALPVGGFTYSQGLEWAVEAGWIRDSQTLMEWLDDLIKGPLSCLDLPVLGRLHRACARSDVSALSYWGRYLYASRETRELRAEERHRAWALRGLIGDLGIPGVDLWHAELGHCHAASFALAAVHWDIGLEDCLLGYAWSWLEGQVAAAVKLVPLGQTDGQRTQLALASRLPAAVERGLALPDASIGSTAPFQAIASALHEIQYTRLFRS